MSKAMKMIKWVRKISNLSNFQTKYTLLDERDIGLVHQLTFEARLEVDWNGGGARVFAICYIFEHGKESGVHVEKMLWERHHGGIAHGWTVVHKNCVTVDNRYDQNTKRFPGQPKGLCSGSKTCNWYYYKIELVLGILIALKFKFISNQISAVQKNCNKEVW